MNELMDKLSRMTVQNGASLNEENIAKSKIQAYATRMSQYKTVNPTPVYTYDDVPMHEKRFRMKWEQVKRENRKKWKIDAD